MTGRPLHTFGVVGAGVIGSGWATRALARGLDVVAADPAPGAEDRLRAAVWAAWPAATRLGLFPGADPDRLTFVAEPEGVVAAADFIQESVPEREELKQDVLRRIDGAAPAGLVVASSSSGLLPTRLQRRCAHPERLLVGHPFNPVYLLPLVEVVPGAATDAATVNRAADVYRDLGMHPLVQHTEIEGYLSDRLQEAMWREALHMVSDGVATTRELDEAIIYGPGLRWAAMGTCLTFHLAGGEGGMRHMLEQFGPALQLPWTKLEAPVLTPELVEAMVDGTLEQAEGRSVSELTALRDDYLISVMRALRPVGIGAGNIIADREARIGAAVAPTPWEPGDIVAAPLRLYECRVAPDWVDYNQHMSESFYLLAFGWASDALFRYVGIDEKYREAGHSFFTVETHINYLAEASLGDRLRFTTQLLGLDEKRLHLFHTMLGDDGGVIATTEQMLLHVDTTEGSSAPILAGPNAALLAVAERHTGLPVPEAVGNRMQIPSG